MLASYRNKAMLQRPFRPYKVTSIQQLWQCSPHPSMIWTGIFMWRDEKQGGGNDFKMCSAQIKRESNWFKIWGEKRWYHEDLIYSSHVMRITLSDCLEFYLCGVEAIGSCKQLHLKAWLSTHIYQFGRSCFQVESMTVYHKFTQLLKRLDMVLPFITAHCVHSILSIILHHFLSSLTTLIFSHLSFPPKQTVLPSHTNLSCSS